MVSIDHSCRNLDKIGKLVERQTQERKKIIVGTRSWRELVRTGEVQRVGNQSSLEKNEGCSGNEIKGAMLDLSVGKWEDTEGHT